MGRNPIELRPGQRFARLVAVRRNGSNHKHESLWLFRCDCGKTKTITASGVRTGNNKSCGCLALEISTKHGAFSGGLKCSTLPRRMRKMYSAWIAMKTRCYNRNYSGYSNYGGRGIRVCNRWLNSFANFVDDMGMPPSRLHTIERRSNSGNYTPSNCRWATRAEQARNRRTNNNVTINGVTMCRADWASRIGIGSNGLKRRINRGLAGRDLIKPSARFK